MRLFRWSLALALALGLVAPAAALAHTKVKTRISTLNGTRFERYWQYETTSTTPPTVKGRLTYYQRSTGKWIGYGYRTVTLVNESVMDPVVIRKKTDKWGYFSAKLSTAGEYQLRHPADHYSYSSAKVVDRTDWVHVETATRISTSSVDASNTRIDVEVDYLYNPYITDSVGAGAYAGTFDPYLSETYEPLFLYSGWCADTTVPRTGSATARFGFVVQNSVYQNHYITLTPRVDYLGPYICENTSDEEGWFGLIVNPEVIPPYEPEDHTGDPEWDF